jgi:altronate dehydratase
MPVASENHRSATAAMTRLLPAANALQRTAHPLSHLTLALECGGSDAYSGITANPALGVASDELVRHGGTSVLAKLRKFTARNIC